MLHRGILNQKSRPPWAIKTNTPGGNRGGKACLRYDLNTKLKHTVTIISIRTTNFGWARPNRVFSQAVLQKFAAGHPKFGAEREVRASPWGLAHRVSFKTLRAFPKNPSKKMLGAGWRQGFRWYERPGECHERTQAVALKEWWTGLHSAERESEFTAAGRQAGLPNKLHPKFELAKSMAVPNLQLGSIRSLNWPANRSSLKRPIRNFVIRILIIVTVYK